MALTTQTLKLIKSNIALVRALEDHHNRRPFTMQTWLRKNNRSLSEIDSLIIIAKHLDTDMDSLREKTKAKLVKVV